MLIHHIADAILAAPTAEDAPGKGIINSPAFIKFLVQWIAPIFVALLGILFLARAKSGEVSKVITSSGIAIVGFVFIGGAFLLPALGGTIVDQFIGK
jgi:hypothetical protein